MSATTVGLAELAGTDLGTSTASYDDTAVILYALAVGASATDLAEVQPGDTISVFGAAGVAAPIASQMIVRIARNSSDVR